LTEKDKNTLLLEKKKEQKNRSFEILKNKNNARSFELDRTNSQNSSNFSLGALIKVHHY